VRFRRVGEKSEAQVENASPEPALVQVHDPAQAGPKMTRLLELAPKSVTPISLQGNGGFLRYCGGAEVMRLGAPDDPFCVRNQAVRKLEKRNGSVFLFATRENPAKGYELDEQGAEIWKRAGGFTLKSSVRNEQNAATYDKLLAAGLIQETLL